MNAHNAYTTEDGASKLLYVLKSGECIRNPAT